MCRRKVPASGEVQVFVDWRVTPLSKSVDTRFTITKPEYIRALRRYYQTRLQPIRDTIAAILAICAGLYLYLFTSSRILPWFLIDRQRHRHAIKEPSNAPRAESSMVAA